MLLRSELASRTDSYRIRRGQPSRSNSHPCLSILLQPSSIHQLERMTSLSMSLNLIHLLNLN
jgi:hypothetical protein